MKRLACLFILLLAVPGLACSLSRSAATPTLPALTDAFFNGHAYQDTNGSGRLDAGDLPLAGARFTAGAFGAVTDKSGSAQIVIPGGWLQPLSTQMSAPPECGCDLIGPAEVTLQTSRQTSADFLFTAARATPTGAPNPTSTSVPVSISPVPSQASLSSTAVAGAMQKDLTYCTTGSGVALKMDLRYPQQFKSPAPLVIYVHGGAWQGGDKAQGSGMRFVPTLLERGYIIASINYRLAPEYIFPAQIEDVRCAVRHLRANAARYGLDPDRIGAIGGSAGGHLVALLGTSGDNPG
jgi:acetyl esterase/lipase